MYLAFYPAAYVGLVLLLRARGGRFPASVWLDGAIGAVGLGAALGALLFPIVIDRTGGDTATIVTNMAYPIVDLALLGLVACVIGAMQWRVDWSWSLLAGGFALFAVADTFYLYQTARGTYATDSWLDLGWPGAMTLVAFASTRPGHRLKAAPFVRWPALVVPGAFGAIALGLLVYDHFERIDTIAVLLAGATVALVIVRLALTFAEYLRAIARSHEEAVSDPLTGLGNRRALSAALDRAVTSESARHALVLFDLDGFKTYNDTFGHPAGDALLERSARALSTARHGGSAYRMGGDEFCLLAPLAEGAPRAGAQAIAEIGADALHAKGEFFEIGSSYGVVVVPDEARTATDAIRLADQRMYARKGTGRRTATGAAVAALLRAMQEREDDLGEHGMDVEDIAQDLAVSLGLPAREREHIRQAAALHDVGKLAIPDSILQKPGRARRGRAAVHAAPHRDRRAHPRRRAVRRADRRAHPREPRALGRLGLPRRNRRRRHSAGREDHRRLRCVPRDGHHAPVRRREHSRGGDRRAPPLCRDAVRSGARRAVRPPRRATARAPRAPLGIAA